MINEIIFCYLRGAIVTTTDVRTQRVQFPSSGHTLTGLLYRPPDHTAAGRLPAVIVTGAWRTVKEQMPAGYAQLIAARGYAALTFDFRGWGESEGRPRRMEDPLAKADDIIAAAEYLSTRPDIAPDAISGLAVCASSGYLASAAIRTPLIAAVALVAPALPSRTTVESQLGGVAGVGYLEDLAEEARRTYSETGQELLVIAVPSTAENTEPGADYYTNVDRGRIPEWDNLYNPASWTDWLAFDAQASAAHLTQPLLIVTSEAAASPTSVHEYIAQVPHTVEQLWLDSVTQYEFYDQPEVMREAADAAAAFLARARTGETHMS